jgi:hypothetical protein
MAYPDDVQWPTKGLQAETAKLRGATLRAAVGGFDDLIDTLEAAHAHLVQSDDAPTASLALAGLDTTVETTCEAINTSLKNVTKLQRAFGKTLDKNMSYKALPDEEDSMLECMDLVNRAMLMHMLRKGDTAVAATFMNEALPPFIVPPSPSPSSQGTLRASNVNARDDDGYESENDYSGRAAAAYMREPLTLESLYDNDSHDPLQSPRLFEEKFSGLYMMLGEIKKRNLQPAISWAHEHSGELEARGSKLEFELAKLRYIWLYKGWKGNGTSDDQLGGLKEALAYAREYMAQFNRRYPRELQQLAGALAFGSNFPGSPYHSLLDTTTAFDEVAQALVRDFCLLLGLAPQPPLLTAVTAGAIALPQQIKYTTYMRAKKTAWTTSDELAFETPLPKSLVFHPIFVCPVLKVQSTDDNPPMMLPCGHVICRESLEGLCKANRFKCPYCPVEGNSKDALVIKF